jgi:peptidoglycan/LPS O-acetylase OafA/YrhL
VANPEKIPNPKSAVSSWFIIGGIYVLAAAMMILPVPKPASTPYWSTNIFWLFVPPVTALLVSTTAFRKAINLTATQTWQSAALFVGRISYALYIVHMPVMTLVHEKIHSPPLRLLLDMGLVFALAWFLEYRVHPYLCQIFDRMWPNPVYKPEASLSRSQTCSI